jgi:hypothetical protein
MSDTSLPSSDYLTVNLDSEPCKLLPLPLLAALLATLATPASAAEKGEIVLHVGGAAGTAFSADCELKTADGKKAFSIDQPVPFDATYVGSGLSCRIAARSAIEVTVVKGGSSSRSSTSGGVINVNVGS